MYFWKVDKLVDDFKSGSVTQKEEFKYMLLFTVLTVAGTDSYINVDRSYNLYDFINTLSAIVVSAYGLFCCYKINSSGDNKNFIVRVICIGLPVAIRLLVIIIPIFVLYGAIMNTLQQPETANPSNYETSVYDIILPISYLILYYNYLARKIKAVSSTTAYESTT
jgi:hypothetical protein